MSDATQPKKRLQRPAAPLWAARKKPQPDEADAPSAGETESPSHDPPAAPLRVPRPGAPRPAAASEIADDVHAAAPVARIPAAMVPAVPSKVPGGPLADDPARASHEESEAVSLQEIETLLSPGKAPPRLPGVAARPAPGTAASRAAAPPRPGAGAPRRVGPTFAGEPPGPPRAPLDSADDREPVPPSSRWGESRDSDFAAMAALVPAPRPSATRDARPAAEDAALSSTIDRSLPNALDSTAADLELMAALSPAPAKRAAPTKPAWAPARAQVQARGAIVAVLSNEAAAALKGTRPAPGAGAATGTGAWRGPGAPGAPQPTRAPVRSRATSTEQPSTGDRSSVVIPAAPTRVAMARARTADDVDDAAWDVTDDTSASAAGTAGARTGARTLDRRSTPPPPPVRRSQPPPPPFDPVAVDALQMRMGTRASLPDPVELLRDSTDPSRSTGRGSVVDPLELYGAAPPKPRPPEQTLPKVMLQVPARSAPEPRATAKTAAASAADARTTAAIAVAEAKAAAASAEANAAFRPKVDLPPRVEPRPFPKPPPRRTLPSRPDGVEAAPQEAKPAARAPAADDTLLTGARPKPPTAVAPTAAAKPAPPAARRVAPALSLKALADIEPVSAEPVSAEPVSAEEDEIPVDFTPDAPEMSSAATTSGGGAPPLSIPSPDSGRFDLQQLMSVGPKSGQKGLGDEDLFSLAGDLFSDTSPQKLVPPDLGALGTAGASRPPSSAGRLLAPVAMGTAPDAAAKGRNASSTPAVASPSEAPRSGAKGSSRSITPWILLPVVAMAAAVVMVWRSRTTDPPADIPVVVTAQQGQRDPVPTVTPPPATSTGEPSPSTTTATVEAKEPPRSSDTPPSSPTAWKPPATSTTTSSPATTSPPAATSVTTPPTAPTTTSAPTTPPPAGNEFNTAAAKAALRNAAGAASGCPSDKPGVASVAITFAPSGRVTSSQVSGSFAGTTTGGCIASAMRGASVPPFEGGPVSVNWKVTIR